MLRYRGHDVILFHILDEAEVTFPFSGSVDLLEPESQDHEIVDAAGIRADYLEAVPELRERFRSVLRKYWHGLRTTQYEHAVRQSSGGILVPATGEVLSFVKNAE